MHSLGDNSDRSLHDLTASPVWPRARLRRSTYECALTIAHRHVADALEAPTAWRQRGRAARCGPSAPPGCKPCSPPGGCGWSAPATPSRAPCIHSEIYAEVHRPRSSSSDPPPLVADPPPLLTHSSSVAQLPPIATPADNVHADQPALTPPPTSGTASQWAHLFPPSVPPVACYAVAASPTGAAAIETPPPTAHAFPPSISLSLCGHLLSVEPTDNGDGCPSTCVRHLECSARSKWLLCLWHRRATRVGLAAEPIERGGSAHL